MASSTAANSRVAYVTPGVFVDGGGWEIVIVNGKLEVKPIPPWDGYPILWSALLIASSLQKLATLTDKPDLEPQLLKLSDAILSAYGSDTDQMLHKLNPHIDPRNVPELRFIALKLFGCDGGGVGIINHHLVKIHGWTPELLVPIIGALDRLSDATDKKDLKPQLKSMSKAILSAYAKELTRVAQQQHVEELVHA